MSIISAIIGSVAASSGGGGGGGSKSASWNGIDWEPVQEGVQNHATVNFTNWDNSTVYWTIIGLANSDLSSQLVSNSGTLNPGTGNSTQDIYFTFNADRVTDGNLTYYVRIGSTVGNYDLVENGPFTCRDSSQTTALVFDLDPASYNPDNLNVWPDSTSNSFNAGIYSYGWSADNGGIMLFDGTTSCEVSALASGWNNYGSLTASIWFKAATVVGGGNQTLIAKESVFKLRIVDNGTINIGTSLDGYNWNGGGGYTSGGENLTAGVWNHLAVSISDNDNVRIYLNGAEVANFSQTILGRNNNPFDIGMWQTTGSPQDYFTGSIGEVMMWNYGLTADQVAAYYLSTLNRYIPQIPAFDFYNPPSSPIDWNDATTSTITATIVGSWTYDSNFGGGVVFDGTADSYIEVQGVNYVDDTFTISMAANLHPSVEHYNPIFDGAPGARIGQDIWANLWGYPGLSVGMQGETLSVAPGTLDGSTIAWWDFVYSGADVTVYKNGIALGSSTLSQRNTGWHSNLRIGNEYNQPGNVMPGTFYRIKYAKLALTAKQIVDQYNSVSSTYNLTPVPQSLSFNGTQNTYLTVNGTLSDWALGKNGTIEWWQKSGINSSGTFVGGIIGQGSSQNGIDIFQANGMNIHFGGNTGNYWPEPNTSTWVHVAITLTPSGEGAIHHLYYDGEEQTLNSGFTDAVLADSTDTLQIGCRIPNVNYQNWTGLITNIHISTATLYTSNFTPSIITATTTGTVLLLSSANPLVDISHYELNNVQLTTSNTHVLYISTSSYPNLDTQVCVGNIVADSADTSTYTTVSGPVVIADPLNWAVPITASEFFVSYVNISGSRHFTTGTVVTSLDVPHILPGMVNATASGALGVAIFNNGGGIETVPSGAQMTSNLWTGTRTVSSSHAGPGGGGWWIEYDATGLSGLTSTSDTYNFYW